MFDLQSESPLTLNEARRLPFLKGRRGNAISLCTLHRWCNRGVGGIVLESAKLGGTVVTSAGAVLRFVERLSGSDHSVSVRPTARRQAAIDAANKRLDEAGIV
ncbi:MAG: DUF1580 domain-containing protein [Tepidisphaeraceae bacterium]|jgi:hypothetical protein